MISVADIFNSRFQIIDIAEQFGFVNVRICRTDQHSHLLLLVDLDTDNPHAHPDNDFILATYLEQPEVLNCQVEVLYDSSKETELEEYFKQNSAPIDDWEKIQRLLPENISFEKFEELDSSEFDEKRERILRLAEDIIEQWEGREDRGGKSSQRQGVSFWETRPQTFDRSRSLDSFGVFRKEFSIVRLGTSSPLPIMT